MPLQSGDDEVLRAMNRWYGVEEYLGHCDRIRAALDRPAFTADVLVGFCGEQDRHFSNTLETVRRAGFARLHVFPFSVRPGTAAAQLGAPPPPPVVRERRAALSELAAELSASYRRSLVGAEDSIVLEGSVGLSGRYQRVRVPLEEIDGPLPPRIDVRLELATGPEGEERLVGRPLCEELAR